MGIAGLEPATIRLKAQCSTNWAIHPKKDWVVNKDWFGKEGGPLAAHHKGRGSIWGSYCRASEENVRARVSTPARKRKLSFAFFDMRNEKDALKHPTHTLFCLPKPYSTRTFLFLVKGCLFPLIEDSIYKRRSTEDTKIALTDTIYEKVRQWNFLSSRLALKPFFSEKGKSSYLCNFGLCRPLFRSSTLLSLSNSVLPDKTDFLPTREGLWETELGTKNESISVHGSCWPAAAQLFERNAVVVGSDSTRAECLVEGPK